MVGFLKYGHICDHVSEKTDHLAHVSDVEISVPCCSVLFTLRNGVCTRSVVVRASHKV